MALHRLPAVKRIRFDPATQPGRFRLRMFGVRNERAARRLTARLLRHAVAGEPPGTLELIGAEQWGAAEGRKAGKRGLLRLEDHFQQVVSLAAAVPPPARTGTAPLVSLIVPVFNTKPAYLDALLASFREQHEVAAELILSDDGSTDPATRVWLEAHAAETNVVSITGAGNRGIAGATNAGLAAATGEWIGLLDHDDALTPHALKIVAHAIARRPRAQFLYTDEIVTDRDLRPAHYFLKPAYDPVLLSGVNYINHFSLYRRERLLRLSGLEEGFQGSQDYALLLRYLDGLDPDEIVHVPYPAYLWRRDGASHSVTFKDEATEKARTVLERHYRKSAPAAIVEPALVPDLHRIRFHPARTDWPLVSVVIPNRDAFDLVSALMKGLVEGTDYPALEIIVVDNGSTDPRVLALYEECRTRFPAFGLEMNVEAFNFSRSVNRGVALARGELVLLLNSDIEVVESGWLKEMVECFHFPATGIVGARLLYPTRRLQHAGVIVGLGGLAGHWFVNEPDTLAGPMGRLAVRQSLTAVTGAVMLISRDCLSATGPFDEDAFAIAYNDIDFCLRAGVAGFRTVWTPFATLIHHESASRGSDERPETIERFRREQANLRVRHGTAGFDDRAFNPWYSRDRSSPIYRLLAALPDER